MKALCRTSKKLGYRAQAITEFAIVLPILLMMLLGVFEVGRLIYIYSVITNASRDGARYGSAVGLTDDGSTYKYKDCPGIEAAAKRFAYFIPVTIYIEYDGGPGTTIRAAACDGTDQVTAGDRVLVTASTDYTPLVKLIPISPRTISASSARTIIGDVNLSTGLGSIPSGGGGGGGGGPTNTPTAPATATVPPGTLTAIALSNTPTATIPAETLTAIALSNTPTSTATSSGSLPTATWTPLPGSTPTMTATPTLTATSAPFFTFTPLPSSTPTPLPTSTKTATPTATTTLTPTSTGTSTPSSSCTTISAGDIVLSNSSSVISMTITNPYRDVRISSINLTWSTAAAQGSGTLILNSANLVTDLGTTIWSGLNNATGSATLTPSSNLTLPGNNKTSTISFTFSQNYAPNKMSGVTTITVNFSTPGCSSISKTAQ